MKVQLERVFALPAPADAAWVLLQDIERVAGCVPGARITERIDERHYKGTMAVKFGPASMSFRGEVEVLALDASGRSLRLMGKGTDATGGSGASMDLTARIEAVDSASCRLVGNSEVSLSGKAAAFGGRMMSSVADQVLKQFAASFAAEVQDLQNRSPPGPPDATAQAPSAPVAVAAPPAPQQLDGLALLWAIVKDWLRSLFAARRA